MKTEGIILSKSLYQERHLIARTLLRSGKKVSLIFYGGRGGGKNNKGTLVELGHCLKIEVKRARQKNAEIFSVGEWEKKWIPKATRNHSQAFFCLCFFLEVVDKISLPGNFDESEHNLNELGNFVVLSNALFRLEKKCLEKSIESPQEVFLFLTKILFHQGVFPTLSHCHFCEKGFKNDEPKWQSVEHGGFICKTCQTDDVDNHNDLWTLLRNLEGVNYQKASLASANKKSLQLLWDYFLHHLQIEKNLIKSASLVI